MRRAESSSGTFFAFFNRYPGKPVRRNTVRMSIAPQIKPRVRPILCLCSGLPDLRFFCETTIFIYNDDADHLIVMYLIIRCPSCSTFTYVDRFQKWKLCPQCGHAHEVAKAPAYLDVGDYHEAEHIVKQMEKHLHANRKKDFTPEETAELRHHYTEALKKRGRGYPAQ